MIVAAFSGGGHCRPTCIGDLLHIPLYCLTFLYVFLGIKAFCLAVLGLSCCAWAFSSCSERGLLFAVVLGLLIAVASLVAEHRL